MKKLFLMFAIWILPVYATDIIYENNSYNPSTGTGMCDTNVLQHDSGTVRLRARYEPNVMNIRWYNNNTEIVPTNSAANTCNYDSNLTVPANEPTRTGYSFAGWRVRPLIDFRTLNLPYRYLRRYAIDVRPPLNSDICWTGDESSTDASNSCYNDPHLKELEQKEWMIIFDDNGKALYGTSRCSARNSNNYDETWPMTDAVTISQWHEPSVENLDSADGDKKYCWCKATGYRATSDGPLYGSLYPLAWLFYVEVFESSPIYCTKHCTRICSTYLAQHRIWDKLFLPAQNAD